MSKNDLKKIEKFLTKKEKHLEKIEKVNKEKEQKQKEKKLQPAIYELMIVIVNRGRGQSVCNYLKSLNMPLSLISFGGGTAPSSLAGLFGYKQEKEVLFTLVDIKDSDKVLDFLESIFLSTESNAGIAFTIPLKSATDFSLEYINEAKNKKKDRI